MMFKTPIWYIVVDWVTRIIIAIIVPVIVVAILKHERVTSVFMRLIERLSMLL